MFAGSIQSTVCHLIEIDARTTICGLKVSTFISSRPSGGRLHLLTSKPECPVCKHCSRIRSNAKPDLLAEPIRDALPMTPRPLSISTS